jgi:hypothetical protein
VSRRRGSRVLLDLWCGIAVLSTVPLQQQIEISQYPPGGRPPALRLLEEGTELLGAWLLLAAGLLLLRGVISQDTAALRTLREQLGRRWWLVFNVVGILSVLATQTSFSAYGDYAPDPQAGLPQWWLGSLAAGALALTALLARTAAPRTDARPAGALTGLGLAAVALSVAYGIDAFTWMTVADASLDRVLRVCLAVAIGICGLWLLLTWRLAGLMTVIAAVVLALGHAAASAWEVGAWWAAAALVHEATVLRDTSAPAPPPAPPAPVPEVPAPAAVRSAPPAKRKRKKSKKAKPHGRPR